ncbi:MAG: redoxin domain-containing protein [candidate division Zixibacteria bacterium]|nr:redoxin domain-containing protein [candidate division Zixibacteria bacterium]
MKESASKSPGNLFYTATRWLVFLILITTGGFAGVYWSMETRGYLNTPIVTIQPPSSILTVGSAFPNLAVLDESGGIHWTRNLIGDRGAVVMFLEIGCEPCSVMTHKWQGLIDNSSAEDLNIFGICFQLPDEVSEYRQRRGLTFPIYSDTIGMFLGKYKVDKFPLRLVVGESRTVRSHNILADLKVDFSQLARELAQ